MTEIVPDATATSPGLDAPKPAENPSKDPAAATVTPYTIEDDNTDPKPAGQTKPHTDTPTPATASSPALNAASPTTYTNAEATAKEAPLAHPLVPGDAPAPTPASPAPTHASPTPPHAPATEYASTPATAPVAEHTPATIAASTSAHTPAPAPAAPSPQPALESPIAGLHAMFPDFDISILEYVMESVQNDQDRAIDMLLGMSDPDYISTAQNPPPPPTRSQTDLDEEFARTLMLEEQEQVQAAQQARASQQARYAPQQAEYGAVPYTPSGQGAGVQPQQQQQPQPLPFGRGGGGVPTGVPVEQLQEQFKQIAETGKKTFSQIVSKVKSKIQEYDQGRHSTAPNEAYSAGQEAQWHAPHQSEQPGSSYQLAPVPPTKPTAPVQGYNVAGSPTPSPASPPSTYASPPPAPASTAAVAARSAGSPGGSSSTPAAANPSMDYSQLGLLPKRPVSLLRTDPPAHNKKRDEDEDELEYVENPFEDGRK